MKLQPDGLRFKHLVFLCIILGCAACAGTAPHRQPVNEPGLEKLLYLFAPATFPYRADIHYTTIYAITTHEDDSLDGVTDTIEYEMPDDLPDERQMSYAQAQQLFFLPADTIFKGDMIMVNDTDQYAVYADRSFNFSNGFTGITYVVEYFISGMPQQEMYLCLFSPQGKRVSKLMVASGTHAGSFTANNGARLPWYASTLSVITDSAVVLEDDYGRLYSGSDTYSKLFYGITDSGQIILTGKTK
jgi:hypothetical protein